MKDFWNNRFKEEGKIWGEEPSSITTVANGLFKEKKVKNLLIPGCSYGRNADFFAADGYQVSGMDISRQGLRLAINNPAIKYLMNSILEAPLAGEPYDGVFCHRLLDLFAAADRKQCLAKAAAQIKDKGYLFFSVLANKDPGFGQGEPSEENTFVKENGCQVHYFSEEDLINHFVDVFSIIDLGFFNDNSGHPLYYIFVQKM